MKTRPRFAPRRLPLLAALAAALAAPVAHAGQLADLPLEELMRIEVVSASRKAQRLADVAASMHVVTADDIRSSGVRSLPEALRLVPGMDVAQISASQWAVSTRGFTGRYANKLLVLVDGRSVYSPMFSGVLWEAERVPLENIERIEVLHGPAGSIWGSNAVNGVINIITRSARETQGGLVDASAGDGGRRTLQARHGGSGAEGAAWRLSAVADRADSSHSAAGGNAYDEFRHAMADLRWERAGAEGALTTLEARLGHTRSDELQTEGLYVPPYQVPLPISLRQDRLMLGARHEQTLAADLALSTSLSLDVERLRLGERVRARPASLGAEASVVWRAAPAHELILGGGLRYLDVAADSAEWISFDPAERKGLEWSLFAQDEWTLVPARWRATAGVRVDHNLYTGSQVQPNLRLLFTPREDLALWTAVSRAVRTPGRGEQDGNIRLMVLPPGTPQNPGPLPIQLIAGGGLGGTESPHRRLDAFELGLRTQATATLSLDAAAFWHRLRDDIGAGSADGMPAFVPLPQPHLEQTTLRQPYLVRLHGMEGSADWRPAAGWRHVFALSRLSVRGPADAAATGLDLYLDASPRWQASWRSVLDLSSAWRLDARVRHVGQRGASLAPAHRVEAYTALDATVTWRAGENTELSVGGTNLLRPAVVEFSPDFGLASATLIPRRAFVRWRQRF